MADTTLQWDWIVTLKSNIDDLRSDFVGGDLLWYPVEGDPKTRAAPDVLVAFGRPKGYRGSYKQWEEGGVAPQVVFEVLSPGNRPAELIKKHAFYQRYGVEEYYVLDPERNILDAWVRRGGSFEQVEDTNGFTSPRLGIKFVTDDGIAIFRPDGRPFRTITELQADEAAFRKRAEEEKNRADEEKKRADEERKRADEEKKRADEEKKRADELVARLRALGQDV